MSQESVRVLKRQASLPRRRKASQGSAEAGGRGARGVAKKRVPKNIPVGAGIHVLCVDDHAVLIEGLRAKFAVENRIQIVGSLASAERLLEETARLQPDLVLLDIDLPGPDIFEMADRLRRAHPTLRLAFLSAHIRDGYLAAAFKCGAWGYFAKGDELDDIVAGLREIARSSAGRFIMGPKVQARCRLARVDVPAGRRTAPVAGTMPTTPLGSLSPREIEVLRLIGKGLSRSQIAKELSRSVKTIDRHQERMTKKLGLSSRIDLVRLAIREGFAEA